MKTLTAAGTAFIDAAKATVNDLETLCDNLWGDYRTSLRKHTDATHLKMRNLVADLPPHTDPRKARIGMLDFYSIHGRRSQARFFRAMANAYSNWRDTTLKELGLKAWDEGKAWEKSLGMIPHNRQATFLQKIRSHVRLSAAKFALDFQAAQKGSVSESFQLLEKRSSGRLSATSKSILDATDKAVNNQEKAWLENVLKGMDQLARNHANEVFDVANGNVMRDSLEKTVDKFSSSEMNEKQLLLSVQTHVRAMMRQTLMSPEFQKQITGAEYFLQLPPTRPTDFANASKSTVERAFTLVKPEQVLKKTGSGDSLGLYAGDKVQLIPVPSNVVDDLELTPLKDWYEKQVKDAQRGDS